MNTHESSLPLHNSKRYNFWFKHQSAWFRILFALIILAGLIFPAVSQASAASPSGQSGTDKYTWTPQDADAPNLFSYMGNRSLRLDTANLPHITYGGDHLYYAHNDGSNWIFETVDPSPGVGLFASLALDSSNRPKSDRSHVVL